MDQHPSFSRLLTCVKDITSSWPPGERIESASDLQDALEASPQRFSNWKKRGVSKEGALSAERKFGVSADWILEGELQCKEPTARWSVPTPESGGGPEWSPSDLLYSISSVDSLPLITWEASMNRSALPKRFRIQVRDNSLSPRLSEGDVLEMRSDLHPAAGDIALLCGADGQPFLRTLRERTPGSFVAVSDNTGFAPLDLAADNLNVLAVAVAEVRVLRRE